jgi:8-oxo-dGTP pyrophosphatase MutT (NUDIX family)
METNADVMYKNPWKILSSKAVYENNWINLIEYKVINPSGGHGIYGKVHFKNRAVGIVPIDDEGNIYLVGQYRFPLDAFSWEIPEGGSPYDEDPLSSAKRELKEETGIEARNWQKLLDIHLSNSVSDEIGHIYLATGLSYTDAEPEETEEIYVKKLPFDEAYQMLLNGEITDSLTIAGMLRTKLLLLEKYLIF